MSTQLNRTPVVREEWWCCLRSYTVHQELADHIESVHIIGAYRHEEKLCSRCYEVQTTLTESIAHFFDQHIRYQFRCMGCYFPFEYFGEFLDHLPTCLTEPQQSLQTVD